MPRKLGPRASVAPLVNTKETPTVSRKAFMTQPALVRLRKG